MYSAEQFVGIYLDLYQLGDDSHLYRDATEKVVSLVSQGVKYMPKCSLIIKYC